MRLLNVKRGTTPTLVIRLETVDMSLVKRIDFVFKEQKNEHSKALITKNYPENGDYDEENNKILLKFSDKETRLFTANSTVYMDTRIILNDGSIPKTSIAEFDINPTLFAEGTK